MTLGTARIIRADSRHLPIADNSVDLVLCSPPYFGLRSYQDNGVHYQGQIGDEPTPQQFIDALLDVTRECVRVLKPTGSLFVNLGDKYAGGGGFAPDAPSNVARREGDASSTFRGATSEHQRQGAAGSGGKTYGMRHKSLMLIPQRYAIACVDQLGLILRAEIIWDKPNGLPESVTDRVRRSHEQWWHFTLQPRYYSAVDEIREGYGDNTHPRAAASDHYDRLRRVTPTSNGNTGLSGNQQPNALGKLPGSVWNIPTQPLKVPAHLGVDHFAAFPMEWPRRIIRGWSPAGVCTACGEGRRPVAERTADGRERSTTAASDPSWQAINRADWQENVRRIITGERCACPDTTAPTTPGVVLDPFSGTGTTALVAKALGRHGIGVDMSADYNRLAEWRTTDPGELARAMQVEKPEPVMDGQLGMFEDGAA